MGAKQDAKATKPQNRLGGDPDEGAGHGTWELTCLASYVP